MQANFDISNFEFESLLMTMRNRGLEKNYNWSRSGEHAQK